MSIPLNITEIIDPRLNFGEGNRVLTTLEGENKGGSIKDHMVRGELIDLLNQKLIKKGDTISEVSSGSTAFSIAHYCSQYELKCILFMPNHLPWKLLVELQKLGAEVRTEEPTSIYSIYESFSAAHPMIHRFNQLLDSTKSRHYHQLGMQILNNTGPINAIIGGVGTSHSLFGTAEGLGSPKTISAEPASFFKVNGIRNIDFERYGEKDPCLSNHLDQRIIIPESLLFEAQTVLTSDGLIEISRSFQLVLAATEVYLKDYKNLQVFSLGASLRRVKKQAA